MTRAFEPGRLGGPLPVLTLGLALALGSCVGPGREQHLAPFYSHVSTARGGEEYEALAGALILRRDTPGGEVVQWGVRPLFLHWPNRQRPDEPVRDRTQFLYPLGRVIRGGGDLKWWFLPIVDYRREEYPEGRKWTFLMLPGIYLSRLPDGRRSTAWWPFWGTGVETLSYDEFDFVLWPLYVRTQREGRTTWHFPLPFFSTTRGPDGGGWRVWPLAGHTWVEDRYDRWFFLWPIFHYNRENLKASPAYHQRDWAVFPLYGQVSQGTYTSHSVLWPFFGYASDSSTGFWAYDGPWPLVRLQRPGEDRLAFLPGKQGNVERSRFWPFWSHYEGDGLSSYWYLWPLINSRHEEYFESERDAFTVIPFWSQWKKRTASGKTHSYRKFWPFYQYERRDETTELMFPQLLPFWYWPDLDEHYSWIYAVYTNEVGPEVLREHALWGLWRREHDRDESRSYLSGLWSRRQWCREGHAVSEQSLLFGLLRWRDDAEAGLSLLAPSFPGPGWPIERVPCTCAEPEPSQEEGR